MIVAEGIDRVVALLVGTDPQDIGRRCFHRGLSLLL
jgi:hypothetical protein